MILSILKKINTISKGKTVFYIILFFIIFTVIGDTYLYFLDGRVFESDFVYQVDTRTETLEEEYLRDIEKHSADLDLKIYAISSDVTAKNTSTYTIYSFPQNKTYIKNRIQVQRDSTSIHSLISGRRTVVFRPIRELVKTGEKEQYFVFGTEEHVKRLRSLTIDKYGMSRPIPNRYPDDTKIMLLCIWTLIFAVIVVSTTFEVKNVKKEVLIRHLNGTADCVKSLSLRSPSRNPYRNFNGLRVNSAMAMLFSHSLTSKFEMIRSFILENSLVIFFAACIGLALASLITEAFKFFVISLSSVLLLILITDSIYLTLIRLNVRGTFTKSNYGRGYRILSFCVLSIVSIMLILSVTLNFKAIHDATLTINQKERWEKLYDYDNVYFLFKEMSETKNMDADEEYAVQFYNKNIDRYTIHLSFDFEHNGGISSDGTVGSEPLVYLNKYATEGLEKLGVDVRALAPDKYYIISQYSYDELREKGIYRRGTSSIVTDVLSRMNEQIKSIDGEIENITIGHGYRFFVYDINMRNLADNYKKNPIIILDTHSVLPTHDFAYHVFNSLIRFQNKDDFKRYIKEIDYQDETWYQNSVKDLYLEKRAEKMLVLFINIILSAMMVVLYNIALSSILKMDFKERAIEVALNKVYGKNLFKRYKSLFKLLIGAFSVSIIGAFIGMVIFDSFGVVYLFLGDAIVFMNTMIIVSIFVRRYEKKNIPRVLKGGF